MDTGKRIERIAVLYSRLSGYMSASLKALKEEFGTNLFVLQWPIADEAPYDASQFDWIDALYDKSVLRGADLARVLNDFDPDAIFMDGWMDKDYLKISRQFRHKGIPVVAGCDTQWTGSVRQRMAQMLAPAYLHNAIDVLWVSGERQRSLARKLGFSGPRCWSGFYSCDWEAFSSVSKQRTDRQSGAFLYIGRYTDAKGIDILVKAFRLYRQMTNEPWKMICAGTGDREHMIDGEEGIENRKFIQPEGLPELMLSANAFVLPSRKEPWGVVVQEAAAAGLPLICSESSGAAVHLLQDRYNGYLFENENTSHLAKCMFLMSNLSIDMRLEMGERSHELSKQFTPKRWAQTLIFGLEDLISARGS